MDLVGSVIWRLIGPVSPALKARLLWERNPEPALKAAVDDTLAPGDVAVDVGANIGVFTDHLARTVGSQGHVYAFEPHPGFVRDLSRIAAAHGNVKLITAALSDTTGSATLSVPGSSAGPNRAMGTLEQRGGASAAESIEVATTTLDAELAGVANIRLLKCDVEGHEHEVLLGGVEMLRSQRPVVLLEAEQRHRRLPLADTFKLMDGLGYAGEMLTSSGRLPLAAFDVERDQTSVIASDPTAPRPPEAYVNNFVFRART